jgi:predicted N-formylglutamate amidohydrolase
MALDVQASPLFVAGDLPPVSVVNPGGASPFLFIGDHAGNVIPLSLGTLGLDDAERVRHIAWDIGVAGLGERLATAMDAVFVRQTYSRLVVDCNRRHDAPDAIAPVSDGTVVPGNADLSDADRAARFAAIHEPYQAEIAAEIARRSAVGQPTVLIALHSFTPVFGGVARPWQIGVLHDGGDPSFAQTMLAVLRREADLTVGDNEPYRMDLIDYTVPRHAYPAGLPYAELEVRQDLIADTTGQAAWAERLERVLTAALG